MLPLRSVFYNINKGIQEFYLVGLLSGTILKQTCVESSYCIDSCGKYLCLLKLTQLTTFKRKFLHFLLHFMYFMTVSVKQDFSGLDVPELYSTPFIAWRRSCSGLTGVLYSTVQYSDI